MATHIIDRPLDASDVREDGSPWPFALVRGEQTLLADEASDLLAEIIDGYGDLGHDRAGIEAALMSRVEEAVRACAVVQAVMVHDAVSDGAMDLDKESEETLTALLGDRTVPVLGIDRWEHTVPLVLVTTDYSPFTAEVPPSGNVLWLDPSDEVAFLQSLANLGLISFYVHDEH